MNRKQGVWLGLVVIFSWMFFFNTSLLESIIAWVVCIGGFVIAPLAVCVSLLFMIYTELGDKPQSMEETAK